jgi:hypothetical protein
MKFSQVKHLTSGVTACEVDGPAWCCCLSKIPQLQAFLAEMNPHGEVANDVAVLLQPLSYARVVPIANKFRPFQFQLSTRNVRKGPQWPDFPIRHLITVLCTIVLCPVVICIILRPQYHIKLQADTGDLFTSFGQPLPDGMVCAEEGLWQDKVAVGYGRAFG